MAFLSSLLAGITATSLWPFLALPRSRLRQASAMPLLLQRRPETPAWERRGATSSSPRLPSLLRPGVAWTPPRFGSGSYLGACPCSGDEFTRRRGIEDPALAAGASVAVHPCHQHGTNVVWLLEPLLAAEALDVDAPRRIRGLGRGEAQQPAQHCPAKSSLFHVPELVTYSRRADRSSQAGCRTQLQASASRGARPRRMRRSWPELRASRHMPRRRATPRLLSFPEERLDPRRRAPSLRCRRVMRSGSISRALPGRRSRPRGSGLIASPARRRSG